MKKLVCLVLVSCFALTLNAQKNVVKLGILGLTSKNLKLTYERALTSRMSLNVGVSYLIPQKLPQALMDGLTKDSSGVSTGDVVGSSKLKGISIITDLRFYSKKQDGAPRGFYYGPYLKFANYSIGYDGVFSGDPLDVVGNVRSIGLGITLGKQWIIKERISIDWNFLSLGVNSNLASLAMTFTDPTIVFDPAWEAQTEADIDSQFKDVPLIGKNFKTDISGKEAKISSSFLLPAIRTGFSIGFAF